MQDNTDKSDQEFIKLCFESYSAINRNFQTIKNQLVIWTKHYHIFDLFSLEDVRIREVVHNFISKYEEENSQKIKRIGGMYKIRNMWMLPKIKKNIVNKWDFAKIIEIKSKLFPEKIKDYLYSVAQYLQFIKSHESYQELNIYKCIKDGSLHAFVDKIMPEMKNKNMQSILTTIYYHLPNKSDPGKDFVTKNWDSIKNIVKLEREYLRQFLILAIRYNQHIILEDALSILPKVIDKKLQKYRTEARLPSDPYIEKIALNEIDDLKIIYNYYINCPYPVDESRVKCLEEAISSSSFITQPTHEFS